MTAEPQDAYLGTKNESLLKEIRDKYKRFNEYWRETRKHRAKVMRYLAGDPWSDEDRLAREDAGRPCISHDELNQYVFQCVNQARQNKRGIKIEPKGNGANDKTAELRQDIARTVEYDCQAPAAYIAAFQDEVEGSYGYCSVSRRYVSDDSDEQEIIIKHIPNPNSVLYDPDCRLPDWSDAKCVFVLDGMPVKEFRRLYPDATVTSFGAEECASAPDWIQGTGEDAQILTAACWKIEVEIVKGVTGRKVTKKKLVQYITNGIEILERNPQNGDEIPVVPFIGLQRYMQNGGDDGAVKRVLYALASFALDSQMSLAYYVSQQAEEAGLSPKVPVMGYVGQFETDRVAWEALTKQARAFIQIDAVPDPTGGASLPLPQWKQFIPNFSEYQIAIEGARRAIQAAMGTSPLPTQAQKQNEKSKIALEFIANQQNIGSFHFIDGYERAVARIGRIVDSWIPSTYDTEREMWLQMRDETRRRVKLNTPEPYPNEDNPEEMEHYPIGEKGEDQKHNVTISAGPSAASQREVVERFVDLLVGELDNLPLSPQQKAKILAIAIQMKELGPKGDEIANIISPDDKGAPSPQIQALTSQFQEQMKALNAYAKSLEEENGKLTFEKQAKIVDNEFAQKREQFKAEVDLAKAEITTKAQSMDERLTLMHDLLKKILDHAHERGMQAEEHAQAQLSQQADQEHQQQMPAVTAAAQPEPAGAEA